jgi:soluble P-type ATPase
MIQIDIPLRGVLTLEHAVFDINGTLAVDGSVVTGVAERLRALGEMLSIHALTAGSHGNLEEIERALGIPLRRISTGEEKYQFVQQLGPAKVVAIGNGMNDVGMLRVAALGIAVLSGEGAATMACQAADVLALGPLDAIDLLLKPQRLIATLRR